MMISTLAVSSALVGGSLGLAQSMDWFGAGLKRAIGYVALALCNIVLGVVVVSGVGPTTYFWEPLGSAAIMLASITVISHPESVRGAATAMVSTIALGLALVAAALTSPGAVSELFASVNQILANGIDAALRGVGV